MMGSSTTRRRMTTRPSERIASYVAIEDHAHRSGDVFWATPSNTSLIYTTSSGTVVLKGESWGGLHSRHWGTNHSRSVDNETFVPYNEKRYAPKLLSKTAYEKGTVWVMDAVHMPYGCSVWPALWTRKSPRRCYHWTVLTGQRDRIGRPEGRLTLWRGSTTRRPTRWPCMLWILGGVFDPGTAMRIVLIPDAWLAPRRACQAT